MVRRDQAGDDGAPRSNAWPSCFIIHSGETVQVWAARLRRLLSEEARKLSGSGTPTTLQVRGTRQRLLPEEAEQLQLIFLEPPDWDQ